MVAMKPGNDGHEWWLCPRCYEDGLRKMNGELNEVESPPKPAPPVKDKKTRPPHVQERSAAKADVGSFERDPNERRSRLTYTGGINYIPDDDDGFW